MRALLRQRGGIPMIGPRAYENLFYWNMWNWTSGDIKIKHEGMLYTYSGDGVCELFDTIEHFQRWCIEDATERQGEYADKKEMIE